MFIFDCIENKIAQKKRKDLIACNRKLKALASSFIFYKIFFK